MEHASVIGLCVLPMVGKVHWPGFDKTLPMKCYQLQMKILKHIEAKNAEKLIWYLALCIQSWPDDKDCPVEKEIIEEAIDTIAKIR